MIAIMCFPIMIYMCMPYYLYSSSLNSPIVLFICLTARFPIFAWTLGSLRFGSAEIDRFKAFIDRPGDFLEAIVSMGEVSSVLIVGTSPENGL